MAKARQTSEGDALDALGVASQSAALVHTKAVDALATAKARIAAIDATLDEDAQHLRQLTAKHASHAGILAKQGELVSQKAKALRSAELAASFAEGSDAAVVERATATLNAARSAHDAEATKLLEWSENAATHVADDDEERQEIAARKAQLEAERATLAEEVTHLEAAQEHTSAAAQRAELEHLDARMRAASERKADSARLTAALEREIDELSTARLRIASRGGAAALVVRSTQGDADAALADSAQAAASLFSTIRRHVGNRAVLRFHGQLLAALAPKGYTPSKLLEVFSHGLDESISGGDTPAELLTRWQAATRDLAGAADADRTHRSLVVDAVHEHNPALLAILSEGE